ncbi:MAG: hypothetical protein GC162_14920 [Planctomycetes bacterium]|nr:hypothetical protein [Planctomycetota bacterium]
MNVVIWARVSSREQSEGYSLDAQIRINRDRAEREGWTVLREFVVAESARRGVERAAFNEMYRWVKQQAKRKKIEAVLAHKLDRICRNMRDAVRMQELEDATGVKMVFVDNEFGPGAAGAFSFNVMAAVSQYYSDNLRQEVRKGQDEKIRQGWMPCGVPYGYMNTRDPDEPIRPDPEKAKLIVRVFQLYSQGGLTMRMIADQLHREGYVHRPSQPRLSPGTISYMLANRFYVGELPWRGQVYPGKHQPLIDRHTFALCQANLAGKNRRTRRITHTFASGLFRCRHCDATMTGERIRRKQMDGSVKIHCYYRCANNRPPARHPRVRWREADIEQAVLDQLNYLRMPTPELRDWLLDVLKQATGQLHDEQVKQIRMLKRRATELSKQRDRLMTLYLQDEVNTARFREMRDNLQQQVNQIEAAISRLGSEGAVGSGVAERAFDFTQNPVEGWRQLDMAGKQRILRAVSTRRTLTRKRVNLELRKPFSLVKFHRLGNAEHVD